MRRRSQRMDTVIILYFGTSARSLSYVDCESRGKKYIRSVFAFVLCSCVRLSTHAARDETSTHLYSGAPLDAPFFRACTEPDRVLDGSPEAPRDEIHAPVRRELGCWPSPSSSPWTISARTGKITRRRRRPSVTELTHHPPERSGSSETSTLETPSPPSLASIDRTNARTLNHPHRSSSRRPHVVLASSTAPHPFRERPPASSLGSPMDGSHRRPRLARAHLGLLLTAGQSLGGLGGLRFGRFRRHLSFVCDARDREAASIARAPPRGRGRPRARRCDRSVGHTVRAFSARFTFNTRARARLGFYVISKQVSLIFSFLICIESPIFYGRNECIQTRPSRCRSTRRHSTARHWRRASERRNDGWTLERVEKDARRDDDGRPRRGCRAGGCRARARGASR